MLDGHDEKKENPGSCEYDAVHRAESNELNTILMSIGVQWLCWSDLFRTTGDVERVPGVNLDHLEAAEPALRMVPYICVR